MSAMFKELWDDYVVKVLNDPRNTPEALEEAKRVFHAGAFAYLVIIDRIGLIAEKDEKSALEELTKLKTYIMRYMVDRMSADKLNLNIQAIDLDLKNKQN